MPESTGHACSARLRTHQAGEQRPVQGRLPGMTILCSMTWCRDRPVRSPSGRRSWGGLTQTYDGRTASCHSTINPEMRFLSLGSRVVPIRPTLTGYLGGIGLLRLKPVRSAEMQACPFIGHHLMIDCPRLGRSLSPTFTLVTWFASLPRSVRHGGRAGYPDTGPLETQSPEIGIPRCGTFFTGGYRSTCPGDRSVVGLSKQASGVATNSNGRLLLSSRFGFLECTRTLEGVTWMMRNEPPHRYVHSMMLPSIG